MRQELKDMLWGNTEIIKPVSKKEQLDKENEWESKNKVATPEKIAKILDTTTEILAGYPKEITDEMLAAYEIMDTNTEEECGRLFDTLKELQLAGSLYKDMEMVSRNTGIDLGCLLSLDQQDQLMIIFEYAASDFDGRVAYECLHEALQVRDLPDVAKLLGAELDRLRSYPREVCEQLCGAYAMEYEENGDNEELIAELNEIIEEAEEKQNESNN